MDRKHMLLGIIIIILSALAIFYMDEINHFLTFTHDEQMTVGGTRLNIPETWNRTSDYGMNNESEISISNGYIIYDIYEDWPESNITSLSEDKFRQMENGNYEILNTSTVYLDNTNVSKQIFKNPSRDTNTTWDCIGIYYVFRKEDKNYAIKIHYFTKIDYANEDYLLTTDQQTHDLMEGIHNNEYNALTYIINRINELFQNN